MPLYEATRNSLSVPRLDDKGKPTAKNILVRFGGRPQNLPEADAKPFVEAGLLREHKAESTEQTEGSEVNGPGAQALQTFPVQRTEGPEEAKRPAKSANLEDWQAYATVLGVDFDEKTTKAELQKRVEQAEATGK